MLETCKVGCGVVLQRNKLKVHEKKNCSHRIVECEHCREEFKSFKLSTHLHECPKMEVTCLLCGIAMYNENFTTHVEENCPEKETECLFARFKCEVIIKRKLLDQHLEEKRTEHLELKLTAMEELIMKQNKTIENLNETIARRFANFEKELATLKTGVKIDEDTSKKLSHNTPIPKNVSYPFGSDKYNPQQREMEKCSLRFRDFVPVSKQTTNIISKETEDEVMCKYKINSKYKRQN